MDMGAYASCSTSSDASGSDCISAIDGSEGTAWVSDDGIGAYFKVEFDHPAYIHEIRIMQRHYWQSNFKTVRLSFSDDGENMDVTLKKRNGSSHADEEGGAYWDIISFPRRRTTFINIYALSTYGNSDNGLIEVVPVGHSVYGVIPHAGFVLVNIHHSLTKPYRNV